MAKKARKGRGGAAEPAAGGFEVEDPGAEPVAGAGLETGLIFVTFVALLVGFVLSQIDLSSNFGQGWIF